MRGHPPTLIHDLIRQGAQAGPDAAAVIHRNHQLTYSELSAQVKRFASSLIQLALNRNERVAVYLPKVPETVVALFGAAHAGGVFVPINPLLKPAQVSYILRDCNVRVLVTSPDRLSLLKEVLPECRDLHTVVVTGDKPAAISSPGIDTVSWNALMAADDPSHQGHARIDTDMAAILYTSGSTGKPKGVVLSHRNMVAGAHSVASYLENTADDRLLAVLPFSFDYGLSQLTTAFSVGASVVLMDYLLPRDVIRAVVKQQITGLAAVPPLWNQLAQLEWPAEAAECLRYLTNSGGAMPAAITRTLQQALPDTDFYLMYGLTEAFRSTYLAPDQVAVRPDSMGKAIPNAEILVVREDGSECAAGEPGELVHRGSLVAMGYWNDPGKTAERFRPAPGQPEGLPLPEIAVWSGDQVRRDDQGYLYFISRKDEMIKTSGYRVSPTEVEEVLYASGLAAELVALGVTHPTLGQGILLVVKDDADAADKEAIISFCKRELPNFMVPQEVVFREALPRNANGKIDRKSLASAYRDFFTELDTVLLTS